MPVAQGQVESVLCRSSADKTYAAELTATVTKVCAHTESICKAIAAFTMHKGQSAPELLDVGLKSFVACQQSVVVQQSSVKPALHLTSIQGMVTYSMASRIDATHVCACLQDLQPIIVQL